MTDRTYWVLVCHGSMILSTTVLKHWWGCRNIAIDTPFIVAVPVEDKQHYSQRFFECGKGGFIQIIGPGILGQSGENPSLN